MKKSELYREIQMAIMRDEVLTDDVRLDMIRELQEREELEKLLEKREQEKSNEEN